MIKVIASVKQYISYKELLAKPQRTSIVMNSSCLVITQMIGSLSTSGVHRL